MAGKVAVEIKRVTNLDPKYQIQVLRYLSSLQMKVGLIVNFGKEKLEIKRMILPDKYLLKSAFNSA